MRVLVVDDEVSICSSIADFLRQEGFEVTEAYDPASALAIVREQSPAFSAVVSDVNMPGMDGFQMWEHMRPLLSPECKVLFMTGVAPKHSADAAGTSGEILEKPFSFTLLVKKLMQSKSELQPRDQRHRLNP